MASYWDEVADSTWLEGSDIFQWFGGSGHGLDQCVTDGPFANLQLHLSTDRSNRPYCLSREVRQDEFVGAGASYVEACYKMDDFYDAWPCYEGFPHEAGHNGIGGVVSGLHHAWCPRRLLTTGPTCRWPEYLLLQEVSKEGQLVAEGLG